MNVIMRRIGFVLPLLSIGFSTINATAIDSASTRPGKSSGGHNGFLRIEQTGLKSAVSLDGAWSSHRVVTELIPAGKTAGKDISTSAQYYVDDPKIVTFKDGVIRPLRDGKTSVTVAQGMTELRIPVQVRNVRTKNTPNFIADVEPILTRFTCNSGGCHGATQGKGGFRLSLQAFDPDLDFMSITKASAGRRITPAQPMNSLLLRKSTLSVAHKGGQALPPGTAHHNLISEWIRLGTPGPTANEPTVNKIEIYPSLRTLRVGDVQKFRIIATLSDNSTRDVSEETLFSGSDAQVANVSSEGIARVVGKGSSSVLARYRDAVTAATIDSPYSDDTKQIKRNVDDSKSAVTQAIDTLVDAKLTSLGLTASRQSSDSEFLRRITLDLTGTIPKPTDIVDFLKDREVDKRSRAIDRLLASAEYVDYWTLFWGDYTRASTKALGDRGLASMNQWLRSSVAFNKPFNVFARELVTASGSNYDDGASGFFRAEKTPEALVEATSQVFLGIRIGCAKCHNHPYERYKQYEYYQMTAFFARTKTKNGTNPDETIVYNGASGESVHPRTGKVMQPTPIDGKALTADFVGDRREALADWITASTNPFFARNIVNRVWKQLMGIGLVEPVDDMRVTNPPSNPKLLDRLALDFMRSGFDIRALIKNITETDTYQRTALPTKTNKADAKYYSHFTFKRLSAEPLMDAVSSALGINETLAGFPSDMKAVQLPDTSATSTSYFLDLFGRPARNVVCQCERADTPTIGQLLHLMNAKGIQDRIANKDNRLGKLLASGKSDSEILNALYLATLGRMPSTREQMIALLDVDLGKDRRIAWEDIQWALLNQKEFLFNH